MPCVNRYVPLATVRELVEPGTRHAEQRAIEAVSKGLLEDDLEDGHLLHSYCGAPGVRGCRVVRGARRPALTGTPSRIGGIGLAELAEGALARHARGVPEPADELLPVVGLYAWRRDGEHHQWDPETIALLQHAVRGGGRPTYEQFAATVNADSARPSILRGLLRFRRSRSHR